MSAARTEADSQPLDAVDPTFGHWFTLFNPRQDRFRSPPVRFGLPPLDTARSYSLCPDSDQVRAATQYIAMGMCRLMHRSKARLYSITSSAATSSVAGTVPSPL
jgi:hypothetical protein